MDTRAAQTLVDLRGAGIVVVTLRAHTCEAVDAVNAGAAAVARIDGALIHIDVAHGV